MITVSYKVAVASSDGKYVNQHFGMTKQFLIFEISDQGDYKFLELRENKPACDVGGHTEDAMTASVKIISDCQASYRKPYWTCCCGYTIRL